MINRFGFNNDGDRGDRRPARGAAAGRRRRAEPRGQQDEPRPRRRLRPGAGRAPAAPSTSPPSTSPRPTPSGCATCRAARRSARSSPASPPPTAALARPVPLFLKIAPDLDRPPSSPSWSRRRSAPASTASSPPTPRWPATACRSRHAGEAGGLSGAPLFARSTARPRPRPRADRGPAAADRRRRRRLGRGRLRQDPRRRLGGAALYRAGLRRARRSCRASSPGSTRCSPATASPAWPRRWGPADC